MKKLLVVANPYPPMASAGTTRVVRFLRHLPDEGWEPSVLTAQAEGPAAVPPGVRVRARGRAVAEAAARRRPAEHRRSTAGWRCPTPTSPGSGRLC